MRMPWDRLPRKIISSWVRSKRPKGCPNLIYVRSLKKSLKKADVVIENWDILSFDRDGSTDVIDNIPIIIAFRHAILLKIDTNTGVFL